METPPRLIDPTGFRKAYIRQPFDEVSRPDYFQIVRVEQVAPRLVVPTLLHRTTYNYLVFLTQGEGRQLHNLDEVEIDAQRLLLVRAGTITAIQAIQPPAAGFFIGFDPIVLERLLNPIQLQQWLALPAVLPLTAGDVAWCFGLCHLLADEQAQGALTDAALHLLAGLIIKLLPKATLASTSMSREEQLATQFKQLVYTHCIQRKDLAFYADLLAISENYLFRCVKTATGKAPKTILLETLVLYARVQLQNTTTDIATIAYSLNLQDPSYFGRLFRKVTGQTPSDYRRAMQDSSG